MQLTQEGQAAALQRVVRPGLPVLFLFRLFLEQIGTFNLEYMDFPGLYVTMQLYVTLSSTQPAGTVSQED